MGIGLVSAQAAAQTAVRVDTSAEPEPPSLRVWVVDDSTKVLPTMDLGAPRAHDDPAPITLSGAGGETVAFQLVVEGAQPIERMSVAVTDIVLDGGESKIASDRIAVFLETFIECPAVDPGFPTLGPGRYPDPLVPLWMDGPESREVAHPVEVPEGQRRVLWVDVSVPRDQPAGRYRGSLELDLDGKASLRIGIELDRYRFDLPARASLSAWVPLYAAPFVERENTLMLDTRQSIALAHRYFRMAQEHRFVSQGIEYEPQITWDEKTGALLSVDWTLYDLYHASVLDGSLFADGEPPALWKVGGSSWWGARAGLSPYFGGKLSDGSLNASHRRALTEYAKEIRHHFDERGWSRPELFVYMADAPDVERFPELADFVAGYGQSIHEAKAGILHMVTMTPREGSPALGAVDVWAVSASDYRPAEMRLRQSIGERAWFFQHHEPYVGSDALNQEGLGLRSWGWIAWRYGADGVFLWAGNNWNRDPYRDPVNWSAGVLGHAVLFYPGAMLPTIGFPAIRGPVSSVRMKLLRRGLLDHDYFALLESLGGDPDPVVERIFPYALGEAGEAREGLGSDGSREAGHGHGAWSHDASEWDRARSTIAREIERRIAK